MRQEIATFTNQEGLHGNLMIAVMECAKTFQSNVWIEKDNRRVNAKSALGLLSLAANGGDSVKITADGIDSHEAVDGILSLISACN